MKIDGRYISDKTIDWKDIKVGDVVIEGINSNNTEKHGYRVLTDVDGNYWEYFDTESGYYCSTSPEFCHYLIIGQKGANGYIKKINYKHEK